jgi:hypothetical protein
MLGRQEAWRGFIGLAGEASLVASHARRRHGCNLKNDAETMRTMRQCMRSEVAAKR